MATVGKKPLHTARFELNQRVTSHRHGAASASASQVPNLHNVALHAARNAAQIPSKGRVTLTLSGGNGHLDLGSGVSEFVLTRAREPRRFPFCGERYDCIWYSRPASREKGAACSARRRR